MGLLPLIISEKMDKYPLNSQGGIDAMLAKLSSRTEDHEKQAPPKDGQPPKVKLAGKRLVFVNTRCFWVFNDYVLTRKGWLGASRTLDGYFGAMTRSLKNGVAAKAGVAIVPDQSLELDQVFAGLQGYDTNPDEERNRWVITSSGAGLKHITPWDKSFHNGMRKLAASLSADYLVSLNVTVLLEGKGLGKERIQPYIQSVELEVFDPKEVRCVWSLAMPAPPSGGKGAFLKIFDVFFKSGGFHVSVVPDLSKRKGMVIEPKYGKLEKAFRDDAIEIANALAEMDPGELEERLGSGGQQIALASGKRVKVESGMVRIKQGNIYRGNINAVGKDVSAAFGKLAGAFAYKLGKDLR